MARPKKYDHGYPSVTDICSIANPFNPTWWYKATRKKLVEAGEDLNKVDPIEVCNSYKWDSQKIGHNVHKGIEMFLSGKPFDECSEGMVNDQVVMLSYLVKWAKEKKLKPIAMEEPLYSHKHKFAGTPDVIGTLNGGKSLLVIDWKTDGVPRDKSAERERVAKYYWQLSAYALAYEETFDVKVNKGYVVRASKTLELNVYFFKSFTEGKAEFIQLRGIYKRVKGK